MQNKKRKFKEITKIDYDLKFTKIFGNVSEDEKDQKHSVIESLFLSIVIFVNGRCISKTYRDTTGKDRIGFSYSEIDGMQFYEYV